jgi:hypothetical protein
LFDALCLSDRDAFQAWQAVPRLSADGPRSLQASDLSADDETTRESIDWTEPLFRLPLEPGLTAPRPPGRLAHRLGPDEEEAEPVPEVAAATRPIGLLTVGTRNLGDHIQVIAAEELLRRAGLIPSFQVDRDNGVAAPPRVPDDPAPGLILNGWFKRNPGAWPPHLGFHTQLSRAPELLSDAALAHYAEHGPIGCRDRYTHSRLRARRGRVPQ